MGAASAREKLESKMLKLKLRRVEIKQERMERVKQLEEITGKEIIREPIPDYIDHSEDEIDLEEIKDENEESEEEIVKTKKKEKKTKKKKEEKKEEKKKNENNDEEDEDEVYEKRVKTTKKKKYAKKHTHNQETDN